MFAHPNVVDLSQGICKLVGGCESSQGICEISFSSLIWKEGLKMPTGAAATCSSAQCSAVSDRIKALHRRKAESLNLLLLKVGAEIPSSAARRSPRGNRHSSVWGFYFKTLLPGWIYDKGNKSCRLGRSSEETWGRSCSRGFGQAVLTPIGKSSSQGVLLCLCLDGPVHEVT